MYRRILVALDRTGLSESVLTHVEKIAIERRFEVILFTVMPGPSAVIVDERTIVTVDQEMERARYEAEAYLGQFERRFRANGIQTSKAVGFGDPAKEIADFAVSNDIDLIAMATRGRTGLARLIRGSVSQAVMRKVAIPLLLLKAAPPAGDLGTRQRTGDKRKSTWLAGPAPRTP